MHRPSALNALLRGLVAGLAGAFAQDLFFAATKKLAPAPPKGAFTPPEPEQQHEMPTETVARRVVEDLAERGPLDDDEKKLGGRIVHYAFGGLWGAVYGITAGTFAPARKLPGALLFGSAVWAVSDNAILPAFNLAAPPTKYPAKSHAYAVAAHLVYGAAAWAMFRLTARGVARPALALLGAARLTHKLPSSVRPAARKVVATAKKGAGAFVH